MVKKFGKGGIIALSLHPLSRERTRGKEVKRGGQEKKFEKKLEKIWRVKNKPYLCSRFQNEGLGDREKGR